MPKASKNADEILTGQESMGSDKGSMTESDVIRDQQREITSLRDQHAMLLDRLSRLESVQNQNRLRKYDEINDPESQKKLGRIPSLDGKDPIVSLEKQGKTYLDDLGILHDEQFLIVKTHGGIERKVTYSQFVAYCSGNSIPCIVNDWERLMEKQTMLAKKNHEFQRTSGKTAKINTVTLLKEIKEMEKGITINVTLSEDQGKTYTGLTLDVPWVDVFNALP